MGKNRDIIHILLLVVFGMFIPFSAAVTLHYGFDFLVLMKTFGVFLVFFALELGVVYIYFVLSSKISTKKMERYKPKP